MKPFKTLSFKHTLIAGLMILSVIPAYAISFEKRVFQGNVKGIEECYLIHRGKRLSTKTPPTLIVYLHSFGQTIEEPFHNAINSSENATNNSEHEASLIDALEDHYPNCVIISCQYDPKLPWKIKAAKNHITADIKDATKDLLFDKIVLVGSSAGACAALNYAVLAPDEIKDKITGVVSFFPASDLAELYKLSAAPKLKESLEETCSGKPTDNLEAYQENSFETNLPFFPAQTKVCVISAAKDDIMPTKLQKDLARSLENREIPVKLITLDGGVQSPSGPPLLEAMQFIMPEKQSTKKKGKSK